MLFEDAADPIVLTLATLLIAALLGASLLWWAGRRVAANPWRIERILLKS